MTNEQKDKLREDINEIHGRLHGRQITHKEVAKHSKWSPEELQHVLIEDEYIFINEIMQSFKPHINILENRIKEAEEIIRQKNIAMDDMYNSNIETTWSRKHHDLEGKYSEKYKVEFYDEHESS